MKRVKRALWCSWRHRWYPTSFGWERPPFGSCPACWDTAPREPGRHRVGIALGTDAQRMRWAL